MKRRSILQRASLLVLVLLLTALYAVHARGEEEKIGVVDLMKVIELSKQGKKSTEEMTGKLKAAKTDIVKREAELVNLKKEIEKNAMTMSAEALAKKERQYQDKLIDYQRKVQDYQYTLGMRNDELNKIMLTLMKDVIEKIGKEGGYILILERTTSGVIYYPAATDLTDKVIEELNKK